MSPAEKAGGERNAAVTYAIACFLVILVTLQLWLLTATMNAYLGGDDSVIWPAAIASLICFALNAGLVYHIDADDRRQHMSQGTYCSKSRS